MKKIKRRKEIITVKVKHSCEHEENHEIEQYGAIVEIRKFWLKTCSKCKRDQQE